MLYKFKSWWQHLGLILLGIFLIKLFNFSAFVYLFLGFLLLSFAHSIDDGKKISLVYLLLIIFVTVMSKLSSFQIILVGVIIGLSLLYKIAKKYPFSAFYKGFGYTSLFLLPIGSFNLWYFPISLIASFSEIIHEAHHFEQDKKEGRFTTAHLLNFRISREGRKKWKLILGVIGLSLLLYFYFC